MTIVYSIPLAINQQFCVASIELFLKKKESLHRHLLGAYFFFTLYQFGQIVKL